MTCDASLMRLFAPTFNIMFVPEHFKYGFEMTVISSIAAPHKKPTLAKFFLSVCFPQCKKVWNL